MKRYKTDATCSTMASLAFLTSSGVVVAVFWLILLIDALTLFKFLFVPKYMTLGFCILFILFSGYLSIHFLGTCIIKIRMTLQFLWASCRAQTRTCKEHILTQASGESQTIFSTLVSTCSLFLWSKLILGDQRVGLEAVTCITSCLLVFAGVWSRVKVDCSDGLTLQYTAFGEHKRSNSVFFLDHLQKWRRSGCLE